MGRSAVLHKDVGVWAGFRINPVLDIVGQHVLVDDPVELDALLDEDERGFPAVTGHTGSDHNPRVLLAPEHYAAFHRNVTDVVTLAVVGRLHSEELLISPHDSLG